MTGALEDGAIKCERPPFSVPDHFKVGNHVFSDHDPHAVVTLGPDRHHARVVEHRHDHDCPAARRERLGRLPHRTSASARRPGIDFPGESAGLLRPVSSWYSTDMGSIPIGQGVSVSALQMLAAYNAVANGGKYVAPRLVRATIDGKAYATPAAEARTRRAVSVSTATAVTAMLEEVVKSGTGTLAQIPGYRVAGKTGTARKPAPGGKGYIDGAYMSSFAGFAPADHPAITALVMLDEPTPIFGGLVAAPVFSELARAVLREMRIAPSSTAAAATPAPTVVDGTGHPGRRRRSRRRDVDDAHRPVLLSEVVRGLDTLEVTGARPDITGSRTTRVASATAFLFCCLPRRGRRRSRLRARAPCAPARVRCSCERVAAASTSPQVVVRDTRRRHGARRRELLGHAGARPDDGRCHRHQRQDDDGGDGQRDRSTPTTSARRRSARCPRTSRTRRRRRRTRPICRRCSPRFRDDGYAAVAMEVSSEALVARRVDEIVYDVAAFTNLSQDHLNVHGTMENYFAAKAMLFTRERARAAVVCVDDDWGARMAGLAEQTRGSTCVRCSRARHAPSKGARHPLERRDRTCCIWRAAQRRQRRGRRQHRRSARAVAPGGARRAVDAARRCRVVSSTSTMGNRLRWSSTTPIRPTASRWCCAPRATSSARTARSRSSSDAAAIATAPSGR